jgi:2-oxo-4-hydroxy-4-carboxy-5-ureidoimidazoline decarboxylase
MTIAELDEWEKPEIAAKLMECCGSSQWVEEMMVARPFRTQATLEKAAMESWWRLGPADWLEAFSKHPKIGETATVSEWSSQEQSGMNTAAAETAESLAEMNRTYFEKFGWIFIVCATGKSAAEMLALLMARLPNKPEEEIQIAAGEQNKITLLRLRKLFA